MEYSIKMLKSGAHHGNTVDPLSPWSHGHRSLQPQVKLSHILAACTVYNIIDYLFYVHKPKTSVILQTCSAHQLGSGRVADNT